MSSSIVLAKLLELILFWIGLGILVSWAWVIVSLILARPILPQEDSRPERWSVFSVGRAVGLYFLVRLFIEAGYVSYRGAGNDGPMPATDLIGLVTLINFAAPAAIVVGLTRADRLKLRTLILNGKSLGVRVKQGLVTSLLAAPVVFTCQLLAISIWKSSEHPLISMLKTGFGPVTAIFAFLSAVVLAPLTEELLFRGFIIHWLTPTRGLNSTTDELSDSEIDGTPTARTINGKFVLPVEGFLPLQANLLVSFAFAAVHSAQWPAPIPLFLLAMAFGWLFQRTGSIVAVVTAHAVFNSISTFAMIYSLLRGLPMIPNS